MASSLQQALTDHYERVKQLVRSAVEGIPSDPLLKCLSESKESQQYMLDRIEEIVQGATSSIPQVNINNSVFELQRSLYHLEQENQTLQSKYEEVRKDCHEFEEKLIQLKGVEARFDKSDEQRQIAELRLIELEEVIANLKAKISPLEAQNSKYAIKLSESENNLKRAEFSAREKEDQLTRNLKNISDELEIERKRVKEMNRYAQAAPSDGRQGESFNLAQKVNSLEETIRHLKETNESMERKVEEAEYNKRTIEEYMMSLKQEVQEMSDVVSSLKREKHGIEVELIDCNNKITDTSLKLNMQKENMERVVLENEYMKSEMEKLEKNYKTEKRKTTSLERELDQVKYSHEVLLKNSNEELRNLKDHNLLLKTENKTMQEKLELQFREMQSKLDEERKVSVRLREQAKMHENQNETMKLEIESLLQKVNFYKQQGLSGGQHSGLMHQNANSSGIVGTFGHSDSEKGRTGGFESFASFQKRVKEIDVRIKEDSRTNSRDGRHMIEPETSKVRLTTLRLQVNHLKELFKAENSALKQELSDLKNFLYKGLESLALRLRMNSRKMQRASSRIGLTSGVRTEEGRDYSRRNYDRLGLGGGGYMDRENIGDYHNRNLDYSNSKPHLHYDRSTGVATNQSTPKSSRHLAGREYRPNLSPSSSRHTPVRKAAGSTSAFRVDDNIKNETYRREYYRYDVHPSIDDLEKDLMLQLRREQRLQSHEKMLHKKYY